MLTATAMGYFSDEISRAVVLALFIPLIISSGGNSGSQATTLVIRAMALGEIRLRDWCRVIRRELMAGVTLGAILGMIGVTRIILWHVLRGTYGEHYVVIALTIGCSLIGVVCSVRSQARCCRSFCVVADWIPRAPLLRLWQLWST